MSEPEALSLSEYAYAAAQRAGHSAQRHAPRWEWVLVDEREVVLAVFQSHSEAVTDLNSRFDADPATVFRLRMVLFDESGATHDEWPRGGSPVERAGALARHLAVELPDVELDAFVAAHYLRGERGWAYLAGEQRRCVELWWYADSGGDPDPVGLLVERAEEGAWQFFVDGRGAGLSQSQVNQRVAQVMRGLGDERWTEVEVAGVAERVAAGTDPTYVLGPAAVCVQAALSLAEALHATEPLGTRFP